MSRSFKVGDRIRVTPKYAMSEWVGQEGVVTQVDPPESEAPWPIEIQLDSGGGGPMDEDELELIS